MFAGRVQVFLSPEILLEVIDVLNRPELQEKFKSLTPEAADAYVKEIARKSTIVKDVPKRIALPRDPKDEPYLNLALEAHADFLVTRDKDLLDLMKDSVFRLQNPELTILDPVSFLTEVPARSAPS
jgi:putative PIN family toxin of toxin-antitoxin system